MEMLPYRTHKTPLANDELVLMDVMSFHNPLSRMLRKGVFKTTFALGYCHSLDDPSLQQTVINLQQRRLIAIEDFDESFGDVRFILTAEGGDAWSSERLPVWSRYVRVRYFEADEGKMRVYVWSPSPTMPTIYLDDMASREYGLADRDTVQAEDDWGVLTWMRFDKLYCTSADVVHDDGPELPFEESETKRPYWSNVCQLQKFVEQE